MFPPLWHLLLTKTQILGFKRLGGCQCGDQFIVIRSGGGSDVCCGAEEWVW